MGDNEILFCDFDETGANTADRAFSRLKEEMSRRGGKGKVIFNLENIFISDDFIGDLDFFIRSEMDSLEDSCLYGIGRGVRRLILETSSNRLAVAGNLEDAVEMMMCGMEETV